MDHHDMAARTRAFALRVIRLVQSLPAGGPAHVIGRQVLRSGTSVGANYRAARRARSAAEFVSKLGIVEEEADETSYWFDLLAESGLVSRARLTSLMKECDELLAITVASIRTAKRKRT